VKAWTTATGDGHCSYEGRHFWKAGERIFRVQGIGWAKDYCVLCAHNQDAPPDTGELLELSDAPSYPTALKTIAESVGAKVLPFDSRMAAAGKDAD
jgi:hypothetical protein